MFICLRKSFLGGYRRAEHWGAVCVCGVGDVGAPPPPASSSFKLCPVRDEAASRMLLAAQTLGFCSVRGNAG